MPRVADHDARRRQIAEAVAALVADEGLDAVTVARAAATAGMSVGLVQHYFKTKDDMLGYAFTHVRAIVDRRVEDGVEAGARAHARIEHILLDALAQLLPLDPDRRRECRVTLAFAGRALDNPALGATLRAGNEQLRSRLATAVHNGKECGEAPGDTDPGTAALGLLALVDGLCLQAYADPDALPPETVTAALAAQLKAVFPGPCAIAVSS